MSALSFGSYLKYLRTSKGWTLREVERLTDSKVSNAYLSQLENDKINHPSPNIIHSLAHTYGSSYEVLMTKAGYHTSQNVKISHNLFRDLTDDEERALLTYLAIYRKLKSS